MNILDNLISNETPLTRDILSEIIELNEDIYNFL